MPTKIGTVIASARNQLRAPTVATATISADLFWTDSELLDHAKNGAKDLWRPLVDLHQGHFVKIDPNNIKVAANASQLVNVPADLFRVRLLEPSDTTASGSSRGIRFRPSDFNASEFKYARTLDPIDPTTDGTIYFAVINAGSPVMPPSILIGPTLSGTMTLRTEYVFTLPELTLDSQNPIPGESDWALTCWIVAHALGKERADKAPDPVWIAHYKSEKDSIVTVSTPRQEQEPKVMKGAFDDAYGGGLSGSSDIEVW